MNVQNLIPSWNFSAALAEDAGAPELRKVQTGAMRKQGWLAKLLTSKKR